MENTNQDKQGIIKKSKKDSFFLNMHHTSYLADALFVESPMYNDKHVHILQVMLTYEGRMLVEVIEKHKI